ncbi:MAG: hypothetical protein LBE76_07075 [Nitrososphaerota archaeon]|nr:hypothetical protein [Nitrososphaerota archaeon]
MVSQKPDININTTAKTRHRTEYVGAIAYATADAKDRMKPTTLILFGVNPNLYAMFASVLNISWILFLSLVNTFFALRVYC